MLKEIYKLKKYEKQFKLDNPNYFPYDGITVFCGVQGSGKTLSAVRYVVDLMHKFPKCKLCTNLTINDESLNERVINWDGLNSLKLENGFDGIIYLLDEIHLEFNSLDSKQIPTDVFIEISQQRKQRKMIVGTSQLFLRMAKPFREQVKTVVFCEPCFFGCKIKNEWVQGEDLDELNGSLFIARSRVNSYYKSPDDYKLFDTYAKIRNYSTMNRYNENLERSVQHGRIIRKSGTISH